MKTAFTFPAFNKFPRSPRLLKHLRMTARYYWFRLWCAKECRIFTDYLNQHPQWRALFEQDLNRCDAMLRCYCDKTLNKRQRLQAVLDHCAIFDQKITPARRDQLINQTKLPLAKLTDELTLYLNLNKIDPFEGFCSINIQNQAGESIYDASFTFAAPNAILIASIQGSNRENAQELIKLATKQLHGVRPMFMILYCFKWIAKILDCDLLGILHKKQAKYRWNDHRHLLFNYDEFWQENDGKLDKNGYWCLPREIEYKALDEIQSKKRSMYRKRYEMFDNVAQQIGQFFN